MGKVFICKLLGEQVFLEACIKQNASRVPCVAPVHKSDTFSQAIRACQACSAVWDAYLLASNLSCKSSAVQTACWTGDVADSLLPCDSLVLLRGLGSAILAFKQASAFVTAATDVCALTDVLRSPPSSGRRSVRLRAPISVATET